MAAWQPLFLNCVTALLAFLCCRDLYLYGFSTANGRSVSFINSLNNCFEFRNQNPLVLADEDSDGSVTAVLKNVGRIQSLFHITNTHMPWWWRVDLFFKSFWVKFGSSTTVSVLLWRRPVILKGPRHMLSFFASFLLVQLCPGDLINMTMRNPSVKVIVRSCCAVYKLRKLLFVVDAFGSGPSWSLRSWLFMLALALITIDFNSTLRRGLNVVSLRGVARCQAELKGDVAASSKFVWGRCRPLLLVVTALSTTDVLRHHVATLPGATEIHVSMAGWLHWLNKAIALVFFLHRADVFRSFLRLQAPTLTLQGTDLPSSPVLSPGKRRRRKHVAFIPDNSDGDESNSESSPRPDTPNRNCKGKAKAS